MDRETLLEKFTNLRQWNRGAERAPHKPLLIIYAIGKLLRGEGRLTPFAEADVDVGKLLREFGGRQSKQGIQYPFWRLRNDSIWEVTDAALMSPNSSGDVRKSELLNLNVAGGFHKAIAEQLQNDSSLAFEIIHKLLDMHFCDGMHSDILQAAGIELPIKVFETKRRTANFREKVLRAYEYRCAVCGFDVKLGILPLALEAAHIKWQAFGGPNEEVNGLTLCVLHHKLFDRGAYTLSPQWEVLISDDAHGSVGFEEWLMRFHGKPINFPQRQSYYPGADFISWHVNEVFQGDYRE